MYKSLLRPLLFKLDPEKVHYLTTDALQTVYKLPLAKTISNSMFGVQSPKLERELFGLKFPNPVGLAAGFDKDAKLIDELGNLGFGFIEIGTLTPKGQEGNPKPRLFRLPEDQAIINRMGFNNEGVDAAVARLRARKSNVIVGGNIGKNKVTPNEDALNDYLYCFKALYDVVDYFVVNVSSPNTPDLRALQEKEPLQQLLLALQEQNSKMPKPKPLLLKIAPDLNDAQLNDIIEIAQEANLSGIIATNTTISRDGLHASAQKVQEIGAGGLSGKPLTQRSTEIIRYLRQRLPQTIKLIGVGGIMTAEDALEKLDAGADLVQLYTGFIYEGPSLISQINKKLLAR
ncbi:quinone-dependent dihydroorotate dehydrogenase [Pontibacter sp. BT310]|uniref:Dihydroorotate dehydrogenase (quinone) n=1 Tax=Pontibacter populi TaxID=890055 RepID=A0ABS6XC21_9BACT|nr:quinone-dependent dihydroorotate dehydrogenase [Pontibacter populi]MBJ6118708.1 quinone-dependent dihydroorotate dehydrogenase [Pontibacter sp. BT310]MBR0571137.1 quinone-dependent dihydroorotate dehydrogenase [Microvirga sp. STS03]MBW3365562.1 quinone-dependent dihydroorotate dehydrogenase [Pontibacter populi]